MMGLIHQKAGCSRKGCLHDAAHPPLRQPGCQHTGRCCMLLFNAKSIGWLVQKLYADAPPTVPHS